MSTTRYPIDIESLQKGDVITPQRISELTGVSLDSEKFWSATLNFKGFLEHGSAANGFGWTVRTEQGSIVICDDTSASLYNRKRFNQHMEGALKHHRQNLTVDRTQLDERDRAAHDRTNYVQGKVIQAAMGARQLAHREHRRTTPKIGPPSK